MRQRCLNVALFAGLFLLNCQWPAMLLGQQKASSPTAEELTRAADASFRNGIILGVIAVVILLAAIPVSIYIDRRKKARKK